MKKKMTYIQREVQIDTLLKELRENFGRIKDHRGSNKQFKLTDLLMSAFAMFSLKYVSLLDFENQTQAERQNLKNIYGVKTLISDSGIRKTLDKVSWESLRLLFKKQFKRLIKLGILKRYEYLNGYILVNVDGVEHFSSKNVHCNHCLSKTHKNGEVTYTHSMLCAVIVNPKESEVFVIGSEPIQVNDGDQKNDCERNASKRLKDWLSVSYKNEKFVFLEDTLYSNAPNVRLIQQKNWDFILSVKPEGNKYLFQMWETRKQIDKLISYHNCKEAETQYEFSYFNNVCLNGTNFDIKVNFLHCKQTNKNGQVTIFSWIISFPISPKNIMDLMRAGRSRWKIENETFNTLKNQGYKFEHNYGHGYKNLSSVFAHLMLLAFVIDQIVQHGHKHFKILWTTTRTKTKLWEMIRSLFRINIYKNFKQLYSDLARLFNVQLE
jgi:hypothetical protein